ncbi:MAG: serine/threonine-protein kinase [Rudaea sp.]|uniref:protein kinase domain-containing protein n=1 Tax=Rudaea sp. TaxID=2136325 RepID=UPI0039E26363
MSDPERLALDIFRDCLDLDTDEHAALIDRRCGGDERVRARVESLLRDYRTLDDDGDAQARDREEFVDPLLGARLGTFRVIERVGRGGMGVVYRGERQGADFAQTVALKLIRRGFDFDDVQARFLRERRILARLHHPNLAHFVDGGVAPDGRPWFALEFVRGAAITDWCDAHRLDVRARVRLFLDACAAVQYAHAQLVVHRDLKPGNVLVDESGAVRLLDFGVAGLLRGSDDGAASSTIGLRLAMTPEYAAPEQFAGEEAGVAADVYSLGVILYQLVGGVLPYALDRGDLADAARVVRDALPQPLTQAIARDGGAAARLAARGTSARSYAYEVRGDLARILDKALAKEPQRRYASVEAFADDLSRWLAGAPVRATGNRFGYRAGKFVRRNRAAVAVAALSALALLATAAVALNKARQARIQRDVALTELGRANAVREYVALMFRNAGEQRDAAKLTANDLLKQSADTIFSQFADRPETGQTTALMLGELHMLMNDPDSAAPLFERLLQWPGIERNAPVLASARHDLAQAEYFRGHRQRARELLDQAQACWNGDRERYADKLGDSRVLQAALERSEGKTDAAIATLDRGLAELRPLRAQDDRDVAVMLSAQSIALLQAGRNAEAYARADESYRMAQRLGLERTRSSLAALNNRAQAAKALGRDDEAVADLRRAVELNRELYGPSLTLTGSLINLGNAIATTQPEEALRLEEEALQMAQTQEGGAGRLTTMARLSLAKAYVAAGRAVDAEPLLDAMMQIVAKGSADGDKNVFAGNVYRARAALRALQHRWADAEADLDAAQSAYAAAGKAGETSLALVDKQRQELAAAKSRAAN